MKIANHSTAFQSPGEARWMPTSLVTASILLVVVVFSWATTDHWTFNVRSLLIKLLAVLIFLAPLCIERYRNDDRIWATSISIAAMFVFSTVSAAVSYLLVSTNAPLVDANLAAWDRTLGFDWAAFYIWVRSVPHLSGVLSLAYASLLPQLAIVFVYLCGTRKLIRLTEFINALLLSDLITEVVSVCFPAAGASKYFSSRVHTDVSWLSAFEPLRSGALKSIDLVEMQGLISMPSFHTVLAILMVWAMRSSRVAVPFLMLNLLVVLSTPTCGGHYLVDVLAGVIVAVVALVVAWKCSPSGSAPGISSNC